MHSVCPSARVARPDLLDRARQGDQEAWQDLFNDCYPKVVRVVRRRLSRPMRNLYDSTDIANEVMKSLAAKFNRFDFSSIDGLQAFLVRAAEQKVIDGYRKGHAKKRDVTRDRSLGTGDQTRELTDDSPSASQLAVATEEEEILLDGQVGERRQILELKIQGFSNSEVSRTLGWNVKRVERFIESLRGLWRI